MIGVLLGVLVGGMPAMLGLGAVIGGGIGHLVSPKRDPLARHATAGQDGYSDSSAGDLGWIAGVDGSSDTDCGDSGADGGSCDGGGGDGGGGGD
ncbi:hypothetical protein BH10PSE4_BH10PSE4_40460 [soil metagenome]